MVNFEVYNLNIPQVRSSKYVLRYFKTPLIIFYYYLVCKAIDTAATPGLLCQPRVIMMIVKKQMECRLAGETEVLGENMP
jgi:hypothetical protein